MSKTFRGKNREVMKTLAKFDRRGKQRKRAKKQGFDSDIAMEFHEPKTYDQSRRSRNFFLTSV